MRTLVVSLFGEPRWFSSMTWKRTGEAQKAHQLRTILVRHGREDVRLARALPEFLNRRIRRASVCSTVAVVLVWAFTIRAPREPKYALFAEPHANRAGELALSTRFGRWAPAASGGSNHLRARWARSLPSAAIGRRSNIHGQTFATTCQAEREPKGKPICQVRRIQYQRCSSILTASTMRM